MTGRGQRMPKAYHVLNRGLGESPTRGQGGRRPTRGQGGYINMLPLVGCITSGIYGFAPRRWGVRRGDVKVNGEIVSLGRRY